MSTTRTGNAALARYAASLKALATIEVKYAASNGGSCKGVTQVPAYVEAQARYSKARREVLASVFAGDEVALAAHRDATRAAAKAEAKAKVKK